MASNLSDSAIARRWSLVTGVGMGACLAFSMENDLHRLTSLSLPAIFCSFLLAGGAGAAAQSVQPQLMQASKPAIALPSTGANVTPVAMIAPLGTTLYIAKRGDSIPLVARHYLSQTSYLNCNELAQAIRKANADTHNTFLKPGQQVIIPGILDAPIVEKSVPVTRDFEVRAVYLTGVMAGSDRGLRIIRRWREVGGNAVVFDIKDSDGSVNIAFQHALLGGHHTPIHDLPKFVRFLHSQNMHAIARIAIFRDERLVREHPELAVRSRRSGEAWRENWKLGCAPRSPTQVPGYEH